MGIITPFEKAITKIQRFEKSTQFALRSGVLTITFHKKEVETYFGSINAEIRHGWFSVNQIKEFEREGVLRPDEMIYMVMKSDKVPESVSSSFPTPELQLSPVVRARSENGF